MAFGTTFDVKPLVPIFHRPPRPDALNVVYRQDMAAGLVAGQ